MDTILSSGIFIQSLGYIAVLLIALSFQINNRKHILSVLIFGMIFLSFHQFLLGALVGALSNGLTIIRNLVFRNKQSSAWLRHKSWPYLFAFLLAGISFLFWEDWYSLLPALAVVCSTFALWADDTRKIRILSLLGPILWIPYALVIQSTPTLLIQIVIISSILVAMIRFDRK